MFCTAHPLQTTQKHHDERTVTARTSLGSEMLTLLSHPTRLILQSPNSPTPSLPGRWSCKSCNLDQLFDGLRTYKKPDAKVRLVGRRETFFYQREEGVFEYPHLGRFVYGAYIKLKPFPTPTTRFGCIVGILEKQFKPKTGIIRPV